MAERRRILRSASANAMLQVRDLHTWYGESHVLHGIDFEVAAGEIVTLIGRNGAGKSTILRVDHGHSAQAPGLDRLKDAKSSPCRPDRSPGSVWLCPEERGIYASLTVEENLSCRRWSGTTELPITQVSRCSPTSTSAWKARAASSPAASSRCSRSPRAAHRRALLLLDEPTEGLAPLISSRSAGRSGCSSAAGFTVVLVEQNIQFAAAVTDRHYVIEQGRVVDRLANAETAERMPRS